MLNLNRVFKYKFIAFNIYFVVALMFFLSFFLFLIKDSISILSKTATDSLFEIVITYPTLIVFEFFIIYTSNVSITVTNEEIIQTFWFHENRLKWNNIKGIKRRFSLGGYNRVLQSDYENISFLDIVENIDELEQIIENKTGLRFKYNTFGFEHDR
jgi:hypothetical protein